MNKFLLLFVPLIIQFPVLNIAWDSQAEGEINIKISGEDKLLEKCLESGLKMEYRYELQLCKRRSAWFDRCKDMRTLIHTLEFDPITENYVVRTDLHGDDEDPKVITTTSSTEARTLLSRINKLSLLKISEQDQYYYKSPRSYLSTRVTTECQGDHNETIADISYFLSLGLIRISGSNSGWMDFNLASDG